MKKIKIKKIILLLVAVLFLIINFGIANAIEYGMLGGKPANPDSNVENSDSWFIYSLKPGEKKQDGIQVMNLFAEPNSVLVYAADTTPSSSGGFALKQFSESKDEVGSWVKFYPDAVPEMFQTIFQAKDEKIVDFCETSREDLEKDFTKSKKKWTEDDFSEFTKWCTGKNDLKIDLKGNERLTVPFVFSVPESADTGEHTGGILIQKVAADDTQATNGSAVKLTTRVGVRIYETVPGEIIRKVSLEGSSFSKNFKEFDFSNWLKKKEDRKAEEFSFIAKVRNEGNASVTVQDIIHVKDLLFSFRNVNVEDRSFQVLKNDTFMSNFSWNNPRFGSFRVEREIRYKDNAGNEKTISVDPVSFWIIPWREMSAALVLIFILTVAHTGWKRHQKKKYGGIGWVGYAIVKGDTLASLAQKCKVDWEVLAKTNKIKAPFVLEVGQKILVPSLEGLTRENGDSEARALAGVFDNKENSNKEQALSGDEDSYRKWIGKRIFYWIAAGVLLILTIAIATWMVVSKAKNQAVMSEKISINSAGGEAVSEKNKPSDVTSTEKEEKIDSAQINVKVLNEGAAPGSAAKIKDFLLEKGYLKAEASNGEKKDFEGVVIFYRNAKFKAEADRIKEALVVKKIKAETKEALSDEEKSADIVIILGK